MNIFPIISLWISIPVTMILLFFIIKEKNHNKIHIDILIIIILFIINLRPMIKNNNVDIVTNNLDVIFVIDSTISMMAEDYNGKNTRLSAVKNDCIFIIEELIGARYSVITFNNNSQRITPLTSDVDITKEAINLINVPSDLFARGTTMNISKEVLLSTLNSSKEKEDTLRIVFFISDGEITNGDKLETFIEAGKLIDSGAVLGYGTSNGGNMHIKDKYSNEVITITYYDEETYNKMVAVSKIDENNLKKISDDLKIDYIHMDKQNKIKNKLNDIKNLSSISIENQKKQSYIDIYYFFVFPLMCLLLYKFYKIKGALK